MSLFQTSYDFSTLHENYEKRDTKYLSPNMKLTVFNGRIEASTRDKYLFTVAYNQGYFCRSRDMLGGEVKKIELSSKYLARLENVIGIIMPVATGKSTIVKEYNPIGELADVDDLIEPIRHGMNYKYLDLCEREMQLARYKLHRGLLKNWDSHNTIMTNRLRLALCIHKRTRVILMHNAGQFKALTGKKPLAALMVQDKVWKAVKNHRLYDNETMKIHKLNVETIRKESEKDAYKKGTFTLPSYEILRSTLFDLIDDENKQKK
uniref:Uncharacterized protein n=1 Tax=viral metagenome TaxID=1070528 RepID=A0A2V0RKM4_9ZZZZ